MRIILDGDLCPKEDDCDICWSVESIGTEITDDELERIWQGYYEAAVNHNYSKNLAQYIRELILLRGAK